jgi:osmoprotectant transport system permease protein
MVDRDGAAVLLGDVLEADHHRALLARSVHGVILSPRGTVSYSNPWFSWSYVKANTHQILDATQAHVTLTVLAVALGLAIALPLALLGRQAGWLHGGVLGFSNVLYSIPSLAAIVALYPVFGLSKLTVVIPLAGYSLVILVRNISVGLDEVPDDTIEAARGMGMGSVRLFTQVRLPLALPAIMAGLRIATVSTIELVVIGAYVGQNGYGEFILEGFRSNYRAEVTTYLVLTIMLAIVADALILGIERLVTPWTRGLR